jgi:DNA-binding transcriptional MerR regulator
MPFGMVKIGELSRITGVPVTTLRYQADQGLIPVHQTSAKGTRWFRLVDFEKEDVSKALTKFSPID